MKKIALVLSGGSARGAYEVGVIKALLPQLEKVGGVKIICGTSVGSLNACYLAANIHKKTDQILEGLEHYWLTFKKEHVYIENWKVTGFRNFLTSLRLGQPDYQGFLNFDPLRAIIDAEMNWNQFRKNINDGLIHTLTISATSVQEGRSVIFYESGDPNCITVMPRDPRMKFVPDEISTDHIIASCSIPIFFKPIELKYNDRNGVVSDWFCDGGVRQNTPLLPALTLNADALVIIGLHFLGQEMMTHEKPGLIANIGKLMNAIFLDHVRNDTQKLHMINDILEAIDDPGMVKRLNEKRIRHGSGKLRYIPDLFITPSSQISEVAEHIWDTKLEVRNSFKTLDWLFRIGGVKEHVRGDILSYFFFNPYYVQALIDLGYKDTIEHMNRIVWDHHTGKNVKIIDKFLRSVEN